MIHNQAYETIKQFYESSVSHRSNFPLMNHINEGVAILELLGADQLTKDAFCIHPIVQNGVESESEIDVRSLECYDLACEYRDKANSYLCKPENDWVSCTQQLCHVVGEMSQECAMMLLADKVQNRKDFEMYHKGVHRRSDMLEEYFDLWIKALKSQYNVRMSM